MYECRMRPYLLTPSIPHAEATNRTGHFCPRLNVLSITDEQNPWARRYEEFLCIRAGSNGALVCGVVGC